MNPVSKSDHNSACGHPFRLKLCHCILHRKNYPSMRKKKLNIDEKSRMVHFHIADHIILLYIPNLLHLTNRSFYLGSLTFTLQYTYIFFHCLCLDYGVNESIFVSNTMPLSSSTALWTVWMRVLRHTARCLSCPKY